MAPSAMFTQKSPGGSAPTIASSENNEESSGDIWTRGTLAIQRNNETNNFIQELCLRYQYLSNELNEHLKKRENEVREYEDWQQLKKQYEENLNAFWATLEHDPFVLVLIDGDGMFFRDEYFKAGDFGGREAASKLHTAISDHIIRGSSLPITCEIVCMVYADVNRLGESLVRNGIVEDVAVVENFVKGFTRGKTSFDFIDVGPGKNRAYEKLIRAFKRNVGIAQCRRIYFGCSHDNGYARALEDCASDAAYRNKVHLLEGLPFEKELHQLQFPTSRLPEIFRNTRLARWSAPGSVNPTAPPFTPPLHKLSPLASFVAGQSPMPPPIPLRQSSCGSMIDGTSATFLPRTPSTSTLASNDGTTLKSWAAAAAAAPAAPPAAEPSAPKSSNRQEGIARNRAGQRVDPLTPEYDKAEVDRIKKLKLCNVHFLRKECPFGYDCTHIHDYNASNRDLVTLRLVARMAPCQNGSGCQDVKCIYGHRCPAPLARIPPANGQKPCIFSETCKFPMELHKIDCNVVKTLVIR